MNEAQMIAGVYNPLRPLVLGVLSEARKEGLPVVMQYGLRTFDQQHQIWLQGRDSAHPGTIVTQADSGQSMHNYGRAFDITLVSGLETQSLLDDRWFPDCDKRWYQLGAIGEKIGLVWGGRFMVNGKHFFDAAHFELPGIKVEQLFSWYIELSKQLGPAPTLILQKIWEKCAGR